LHNEGPFTEHASYHNLAEPYPVFDVSMRLVSWQQAARFARDRIKEACVLRCVRQNQLYKALEEVRSRNAGSKELAEIFLTQPLLSVATGVGASKRTSDDMFKRTASKEDAAHHRRH
jgi:hypothetical protein